MGIGLMLPWAIGYSTLPLIAFYIPQWNHLQIAISAPLPIFMVAYYFIPECPRWLLSKGKVNEAYKILERGARINGKSAPALQLENLGDAPKLESKEEKATLLDLFRTPNLRKNTLLQYFNWFTTTFIYYGLTLNLESLIPGNIYVNYAISGVIEIPAYFTCILILHYFGLRRPLSFMFISSFVLLMISTVLEEDGSAMMIVAALGKFGIICVFAIIYLHAAEIFPTVVRTTGLGTCSMFGRFGSMLAPMVGRELGRVNPIAAIMIFAFMSLFAGIFTLWLPETKGIKTTDTIEEGEAMGKGQKVCICCSKAQNAANEEHC